MKPQIAAFANVPTCPARNAHVSWHRGRGRGVGIGHRIQRDVSSAPQRGVSLANLKSRVPRYTQAGSTHPRHAPTCPQRRHRLGATVHTPTCPQRRHRLDVANWHQRCRSHGHELGLLAARFHRGRLMLRDPALAQRLMASWAMASAFGTLVELAPFTPHALAAALQRRGVSALLGHPNP